MRKTKKKERLGARKIKVEEKKKQKNIQGTINDTLFLIEGCRDDGSGKR